MPSVRQTFPALMRVAVLGSAITVHATVTLGLVDGTAAQPALTLTARTERMEPQIYEPSEKTERYQTRTEHARPTAQTLP
jgi:hypothetical protein